MVSNFYCEDLNMTANLIHTAPRRPDTRLRFNRRNFLGLGIAFSGSLLFPLVRQTLESQTEPSIADLWTIGFSPLDASPNQVLVAANNLFSGDPLFLDRGAQVTIERLYLPEAFPITVMNTNVHYYPEGSAASIQVPVWSYQHSDVTSLGATNRLVVPVSSANGLTLSFDWQVPDRERTTTVTKFSVDREPNHLKLQRGRYLIAGQRPQLGTLPGWSDYRWHISESQTGALFPQKNASTIDFPYLLLTIDYGTV
jgi:hypothetical protein